MQWALVAAMVAMPLAAAPPPATAIRRQLALEAAAWNRGDLAAFMATYWQSPQTQFIGANGISLGWQTVFDHYRRRYPNRAAMGRLSFSGIEVQVLCPDAAYVVGHFRLDRAHDHPEGVFTLLWRRFPQGWKIISDHTSATPPSSIAHAAKRSAGLGLLGPQARASISGTRGVAALGPAPSDAQ